LVSVSAVRAVGNDGRGVLVLGCAGHRDSPFERAWNIWPGISFIHEAIMDTGRDCRVHALNRLREK
jgi:hypothetical protein